MGSNELHEQAAEPVRHVNDQSVLVATEVEDHAVVADEVNASAELPFDLVWALPARLAGDGEPDADRSLGLRVTLPEFLQRPAGDHLHARRSISCHQFGDKNSCQSTSSLCGMILPDVNVLVHAHNADSGGSRAACGSGNGHRRA
jgi:hypothetical protein